MSAHALFAVPDDQPSPRSTRSPAELREDELQLLRRKFSGPAVIMAGIANVFLQLSWPEVGYGVVESRVESGQVMRHPFKRFRTTTTYLWIAMFGDDDVRAAYRQAVNEAHRPVHSGPDSPVKYNAFNQDLQLWVASCLFYGLWDTATRLHGPMSPHEEEVLLRAGARFGTTLQVPEEMWHTTMEEFWTYWDDGLQRADIDETVGAYFLDLLNARMLPSPIRNIVGPIGAWTNTGFTPEPIRDQLGLAWTDTDQRRHDRLLRVIGAISRRLPHAVRIVPINTMVLDTKLRRRLGKPMA